MTINGKARPVSAGTGPNHCVIHDGANIRACQLLFKAEAVLSNISNKDSFHDLPTPST
jgi:hypothetical protein